MAADTLKNDLQQHWSTKTGRVNGLDIYELDMTTEMTDQDSQIKVLSLGPNNQNVPTKAIILVGETGAGKTALINSMINHLLLIERGDKCRYKIRDRVKSERNAAESQTDFITLYKIYHQAGMRHEYNYVIIDTPGLLDTREDQRHIWDMSIKMFFAKDFGIKFLDCIGLVVKASQNKATQNLKEVIGAISLAFGSDVQDIVHVMATHATDNKMAVEEVLEYERVKVNSVFSVDNEPLFESTVCDDDESNMYFTMKWNRMERFLSKIFEGLNAAAPRELTRTVEVIKLNKKLEEALKLLGKSIVCISQEVSDLEESNTQLTKLQTIKENIVWHTTETETYNHSVQAKKGTHIHECKICKKVCDKSCKDPGFVDSFQDGANLSVKAGAEGCKVVAGFVGDVSVRTVGEVVDRPIALGIGKVMDYVDSSDDRGRFSRGLMEAMTKSIDTVSSVGGFITGAAGYVVGSAAGAVASPVIGLATGLGVMSCQNKCPLDPEKVCDCGHEMQHHDLKTEANWSEQITREKTDKENKAKYDNTQKEIEEITRKFEQQKRNIGSYNEIFENEMANVIQSCSRISKTSLGFVEKDPLKQIDQIPGMDNILKNPRQAVQLQKLKARMRAKVKELKKYC